MSFKMSCFILLENLEKTQIDLAVGKVSRSRPNYIPLEKQIKCLSEVLLVK